jgi:hypothetical protein
VPELRRNRVSRTLWHASLPNAQTPKGLDNVQIDDRVWGLEIIGPRLHVFEEQKGSFAFVSAEGITEVESVTRHLVIGLIWGVVNRRCCACEVL